MAPYSIHKRVHEAGAVAYVTARLMECTFIAIGIVCMLGISTLRQDALSGTTAALGQGIFDVYQWTFRIGPGFFVGVGNGLILGWLMYTADRERHRRGDRELDNRVARKTAMPR